MNSTKTALMAELTRRYGSPVKLGRTQSLYELGNGKARVYIRYSRLHGRSQTFFGLRQEDLRQLEGHRAFVCFLWDGQAEPLFLPFADFEEVFIDSTIVRAHQHAAGAAKKTVTKRSGARAAG